MGPRPLRTLLEQDQRSLSSHFRPGKVLGREAAAYPHVSMRCWRERDEAKPRSLDEPLPADVRRKFSHVKSRRGLYLITVKVNWLFLAVTMVMV